MKYFLTAAALLAATVSAEKRDLCSDGSTDDDGNYYCQQVDAISYTGVGGSGTYNKITGMYSSGECTSEPFGYSGSMSPLDEEVSMHFRGPLQLSQFAVYTPSSSSSKKAKRDAHVARHVHGGRAHMHHAREAAPQVGAEVYATINGQVVSWVNEYSGESSTSAAASAASTTAAVAENWPSAWHASSPSSSVSSAAATSASATSAAPSASASSGGSYISSSSGAWSRQAYYNAADGTSDGLVFLNHYGGSGSGVFDYTYGASLSYSNADGTNGASSATTLSDTLLSSDVEVVIMSDSECDSDCGYVRNGTVAYHGFDGPEKAFYFEFQMPSSGGAQASEYDPVNMPAIWMLNAQIPRTLQYGNADCSCWTSGCGEFDIFEVLADGDTRMKSTLHGNVAGGDSDYFARPEGSTMQAVVLLYNNNIHIQVLNNFGFDSSLGSDAISDIVGGTSTQTDSVSLFALSS